MKELFKKLSKALRECAVIYEGIVISRFRSPIYRELKHEEDMFMLLCFCDLLGVPNPMAFYTMELYPEFYDSFHSWHKSMGMNKSPMDLIRCC